MESKPELEPMEMKPEVTEQETELGLVELGPELETGLEQAESELELL